MVLTIGPLKFNTLATQTALSQFPNYPNRSQDSLDKRITHVWYKIIIGFKIDNESCKSKPSERKIRKLKFSLNNVKKYSKHKEVVDTFFNNNPAILKAIVIYKMRHNRKDQAIAITEMITYPGYKNEAWREIYNTSIKNQDLELAQKAALHMYPSIDRDNFLKPIVEAHLAKGDLEKALEVVQLINIKDIRTPFLTEITQSHISANRLDKALHAANLIHLIKTKNPLIINIADAHIALNQLAKALEIADQTRHSNTRNTILINTSDAYIALNQLKKAEEIINSLPEEHVQRANLQRKLAKGHILNGDMNKALRIADSISFISIKSDVLKHISIGYLKRGDTENAIKTADSITYRSIQSSLLRDVANFHLYRGRVFTARNITKNIPDTAYRDQMYRKMRITAVVAVGVIAALSSFIISRYAMSSENNL